MGKRHRTAYTRGQMRNTIQWRDCFTLGPEQNAQYFTEITFKGILLKENDCILMEILLNFVPNGLIYNKSTLI